MKLLMYSTSQEPPEKEPSPRESRSQEIQGKHVNYRLPEMEWCFKNSKRQCRLEQAKNPISHQMLKLCLLWFLSEAISQLLTADPESVPASHGAEKLPKETDLDLYWQLPLLKHTISAHWALHVTSAVSITNCQPDPILQTFSAVKSERPEAEVGHNQS